MTVDRFLKRGASRTLQGAVGSALLIAAHAACAQQATMASRNLRRSISLATKSAQLAAAAPQVVAHRMTRMALRGGNYSDQDLKEFARMGSEKQAAFLASWNAMALQVLRYQHSFMISWLQGVCMPWLGAGMTPASVASRLQNAAIGTALSGLAPIHRTARANAKRLLLTRIGLR